MGTALTSRAEEALAHGAVYRLLAQALTYPTTDGVSVLLDEDLPLALAIAASLRSEVRTSLEEAARALRASGPAEMEAAYRAGLSHVHSPDCSAFENDYLEGDVWRRSHQLADIAGFYRAFGVTHPSERPDHVAVELEFLHLLSCKLAWALDTGQTEHADVCGAALEGFLRDHVLRWMPGFAARLARVCPRGPYRSIAAMLSALLEAEAERFGLEPEAGSVMEPEEQPGGLCEDEG